MSVEDFDSSMSSVLAFDDLIDSSGYTDWEDDDHLDSSSSYSSMLYDNCTGLSPPSWSDLYDEFSDLTSYMNGRDDNKHDTFCTSHSSELYDDGRVVAASSGEDDIQHDSFSTSPDSTWNDNDDGKFDSDIPLFVNWHGI
ncbi:uncharacterized protein LOC106081029 isoform X1 [Stomoxys calcitrans]|uniref:uncharacterized protein LOC106081029 isoform X1 n=1 Tax=Stomoxys calcitrans TaxID=35570 RepID=UPI0027E33A79|nr:uncharacterized protein LOC106081029 isoform X1 [Stomoxys calcitrans]